MRIGLTQTLNAETLILESRTDDVELSPLEAIVSHLETRRKTPKEIAEAIAYPNRSITNALQRAKSKMK